MLQQEPHDERTRGFSPEELLASVASGVDAAQFQKGVVDASPVPLMLLQLQM